MFGLVLNRIVMVTATVAASRYLVASVGPGAAFAGWMLSAGLMCGAGAVLLRSVPIEQVTWRNHLAGWLLPWAGLFVGRHLWPMVVGSWVGWVLLGGAAISVARLSTAVADGLGGFGWVWLLVVGWVGNIEATTRIGRTALLTFGHGSSSRRSLVKLMLGLVAVTITSVVLVMIGRPWTAVALAWGPALIVGSGLGIWMGAGLIFGRNARWN